MKIFTEISSKALRAPFPALYGSISPYQKEGVGNSLFVQKQQAPLKRNLGFIRKDVTLDDFTQEKMNLMFCHINSYPRRKLKEKSPLELFEETFGSQAVAKLGLQKIGLKDIVLRPEILA